MHFTNFCVNFSLENYLLTKASSNPGEDGGDIFISSSSDSAFLARFLFLRNVEWSWKNDNWIST